ncbi:MAG: hypothetical protein AAGF11_39200 [Myxococcota bacterium]
MLGVLSVLLLLIPSLLLMAQVTQLAEITISTPHFAKEGPRDPTIYCGRIQRLHIAITHGGLYARRGGRPWERVGTSRDPHDPRALAAVALAHKRAEPYQSTVFVTAQPDVPYKTLVATLDVLRGPGCHLSSLEAGETEPADCWLWHPIIQSMPPDAWPPSRTDPSGHHVLPAGHDQPRDLDQLEHRAHGGHPHEQ